MIIDHPTTAQIPQLRSLWKEAFGDSDAFLDIFFQRAFSPRRCCCVTQSDTVVAALYWFDCQWQDKRLAYLYAVATAKAMRGQGLCRTLLKKTHSILQKTGYTGSILSPQSEALFAMYGKFGYRTCSFVQEFTCTAAGDPIPLTEATPAEYAAARRRLLPHNSVLQEGVTLDFLSTYARLYTGPDLALAAYPNEGELFVCELLGAPQSAPRILAALGFPQGSFLTPGSQKPYTMYRAFTDDDSLPAYFGLALN